MTTVFMGGSRAICRLNPVIREKLDDLIDRGCMILVGDANGADKSVQEYLAKRGYRNVIVYCMDACRNNVGAWQARRLSFPAARKDFAYYATKDLAMAQDAKCGVMLWDGKSKGTLNNIQNLLAAGKKVLVYFAPTKSLFKLSSEAGLLDLLQRCDSRDIARAQKRIRSRPPMATDQFLLHHPRG